MAAALPNGNLIVPVIKNADQLNLVGMAKAVNDLGNRAKAGKLKPDDTQGGTYTVTNVELLVPYLERQLSTNHKWEF